MYSLSHRKLMMWGRPDAWYLAPKVNSEVFNVRYHEPLVGMKKIMGANHKVNSPKISHNFP